MIEDGDALGDPHHDPHGAESHGPKLQTYLVIAAALAVFTAVSFIVNGGVRSEALEPHVGFLIILAVAIVKATLVGMYFMHVKFDWGRLYFIIIPVAMLAVMMMIVLLEPQAMSCTAGST